MKTNYQDPLTSEICSTQIAGLQEAVGKLEDSVGMETVAETGISLTEVYISAEDRYRIFQASAGKKLGSLPAPVIKKNGVAITEGFTIDYAGGAIIVSPSAISTDVFTADVTYVTAMTTSFKTHKAETMQYEGRKFNITNPYKNGGALSLKGQLHCHTTNSDGLDTPLALVTAYKNAGFDFVSITDHDFLTPDPAVAGIIFIPGVEDTNFRHVTAYDVDAQSTSKDTQTVIDFYRSISKLCSIAHPTWANTLVKKSEMVGYYDYNFTEVFNSFTNTYGESQWDWALSSGKKVFGIAVDDTHNMAEAYFGKGSVVVKASIENKASILQALRDGNFYASSGNDIDVSVEGNVITAASIASSNFTFIGMNGRILQSNNGVTSASYTIKGDEMYVRVKSVKVSDSTAAWSQPVFIDCVGDDGRINIDHVNDIAPHAELSDRTITVGVGKNFATIQGAIDSLKKRVDAIITINVDVGTYDETVNILGFYGSGEIRLYGGAALSDNYNFQNIIIKQCTIEVSTKGFKLLAIGTATVYATKSARVILQLLKAVGAGSFDGCLIQACQSVTIINCEISNKANAVNAVNGSNVYSNNNTGTGNSIGLNAQSCSTIGKYGTQPAATTAESFAAGGRIA